MPASIRNRVTEKDIRDWLDVHGFVGKLAKISNLELFAIKSPGWEQVFSFELKVLRRAAEQLSTDESSNWDSHEFDADFEKFWGVVRDDERIRDLKTRTQIWLFDTAQEQQTKLDSTSMGMLIKNRPTDSTVLICLCVGGAIFLTIVSIVSWLT